MSTVSGWAGDLSIGLVRSLRAEDGVTHCDIIKTMNALKSRVDLRLDQAGRSPPFNVVGEDPATSLFH